MIRLIAAIDALLGIANNDGIPWQGKIPKDTEHFHELTAVGTIVMGFRTYEEYEKPLHDRENFVATRPHGGALRAGFVAVPDVDTVLRERPKEDVWVIGGAGLFASSLLEADELALTRLDQSFKCTKFFPKFDDTFQLVNEVGPYDENGISFRFQTWRRTTTTQL